MPTPLPSSWAIRGRNLDLSSRPLVMGILNVTPDSFSDGGQYQEHSLALKRAFEMIEEGADILDVGGESSRPGAVSVSNEQEIERVLPVIEGIAARSDIPISIDTTKAVVARRALEAGAHIVNDTSGLRFDPEMAAVVGRTGAGLVLMHMQGVPSTMQVAPHYQDLLGEISQFLTIALSRAVAGGVKIDSVAVDPGIGFGKTFEHNWDILDGLDRLCPLGRPIVVGTSRKKFLQVRLGTDRRDLEVATLVTSVAACIKGARIVRVHDVRSHRRAMDALSPLLLRIETPEHP